MTWVDGLIRLIQEATKPLSEAENDEISHSMFPELYNLPASASQEERNAAVQQYLSRVRREKIERGDKNGR